MNTRRDGVDVPTTSTPRHITGCPAREYYSSNTTSLRDTANLERSQGGSLLVWRAAPTEAKGLGLPRWCVQDGAPSVLHEVRAEFAGHEKHHSSFAPPLGVCALLSRAMQRRAAFAGAAKVSDRVARRRGALLSCLSSARLTDYLAYRSTAKPLQYVTHVVGGILIAAAQGEQEPLSRRGRPAVRPSASPSKQG